MTRSAEGARGAGERQAGAARALALFLAVALTAAWSALAWPNLSNRVLPDPDDMVRLVQIRDWLAGQRFADLAQMRLGGPEGVALHWSRLPDLVPAAVIALATPVAGTARAEILALVLWPELLFFGHLLVAGALARRLGGAATMPVAIALAALAYPAITAFLPGRIDHHGLQIVLVGLMLVALLDGKWAWAGFAAGVSQIVGLETAPALLAANAALLVLWIRDERNPGLFGAGLIAAALIGFALFRPAPAAAGWCDGFGPGVFAVLLTGGGAWLLAGALSPRLPERRWRAGAAALIALLAVVTAGAAAPECLGSPYGPGDPLLNRIWPAGIGEAGHALAAPAAALGELGLALAALAGGLLVVRRRAAPAALWLPVLAVIAGGLLAGLVQLRAGMIAAALAAPVLAQAVLAARSRGRAAVALATLLSLGIVWQAAGRALAGSGALPARELAALGAGCRDARTLEQLDRLPAGNFASPLDMGAYLIGATGHRALAAPYRRNLRGNRAVYDFFLAPPAGADYQALLWTIDYVALCPDSFAELPPGRIPATSLLATLRRGETPPWLEPILLVDSRARAWRVRRASRSLP